MAGKQNAAGQPEHDLTRNNKRNAAQVACSDRDATYSLRARSHRPVDNYSNWNYILVVLPLGVWEWNSAHIKRSPKAKHCNEFLLRHRQWVLNGEKIRAVKNLMDNVQTCHRSGKGEKSLSHHRTEGSRVDHRRQITGEIAPLTPSDVILQKLRWYVDTVAAIHLTRNCILTLWSPPLWL